MQTLRVFTKKAEDGNYDVYWTNTTLKTLKGIVHVIVPLGEDQDVIAELVALQYLLEDAEVIGRNIAGSDKIKLIVTSGAINKLIRKESIKTHLTNYIKFLVTRFTECKIEVENRKNEWTLVEDNRIDRVTIDGKHPPMEIVRVYGLGDVSITEHAVDQFATRLSEANGTEYTKSEAWRKLRELVADTALVKVDRSTKAKRMRYAMRGSEEGEYYLHPYRKWIFVCTKRPGQKRMELVTAYQLNEE